MPHDASAVAPHFLPTPRQRARAIRGPPTSAGSTSAPPSSRPPDSGEGEHGARLRGGSGNEPAALSKELADFLIELSIALHKHAIYPAGHPQLAGSVAAVVRRLEPMLAERSTLSLGVARQQLIIEGVATSENHPLLRELAGRLHRHQLGAVRFLAGVTAEEVADFVHTVGIEAERTDRPLGLEPAEELARWLHVRVYPLTFGQLELLEESGGRDQPAEKGEGLEGERDATQIGGGSATERTRASRAAQLWIGMARAALAGEIASDEPPPSTDPVVVAKAIDDHVKDQAYDQVVVGYLLQIADELKGKGGRERLALQKRISSMVATLKPETLARLLEMGGDVRQRRRFVLDASQGMAVEAVVDLVQAAAETGRQTISHSMMRMLSKFARHAERGGARVRGQADHALRDHVGRLLTDWDLDDPNPDAYRKALDAMSKSAPLFGNVEQSLPCEPERLVQMGLEAGVVGSALWRAVDVMASRESLSPLIDLLDRAPQGWATEAVWEVLATPERLREVLERGQPDTGTVTRMARRMGLAAAEPLLDAVETEPDRFGTLVAQALCALGPDAAPAIARRLPGARWTVQRQLLTAMAGLPPEAVHKAIVLNDYVRHPDAGVRAEALGASLGGPEREAALALAVSDTDAAVLEAALSELAERGVDGSAAFSGAPTLMRRLDDGSIPAQLRRLAIRALASTGIPDARDWLVRHAVRRGGWLRLRRRILNTHWPDLPEAIAAMAERWSDEPDVMPVLELALRSNNPAVRAAVVEAGRARRARRGERQVSEAASFLTSFAQAISTMMLYRAGHPARERAIDASYARLLSLQHEAPSSHFSFLGHEVVHGSSPVRELKEWEWSARLAEAGIQRLEFTDQVSREEYDAFLEEVLARLTLGVIDTAAARPDRKTGIRFGAIGVRGVGGVDSLASPEDALIRTATIRYTLADEADAVRWMHDEVSVRGQLPLVEAEAVVRSLSVAMHSDNEIVIPLLQLKEFDQYTTTHSLNVSVLAMALAEFIGLGARDVRAFGVAGLLHDLGKVKVPKEILTKPGKLTDEEWSIMKSHPVEGARLIVASDRQLDLAAVVAYEHHIMLNGGGYPEMHFARECHTASRLVHVCDVYDALRTNRPYREAWELAPALELIESRAGFDFDRDMVRGFGAMMRQWEPRLAVLDEKTPLPAPKGDAALAGSLSADVVQEGLS